MLYQIALMLLPMIAFSEAKITYCENSAENEVCFKEKPYVSAISPEPLPTNVNITMTINEVIWVLHYFQYGFNHFTHNDHSTYWGSEMWRVC